MSPPIAQRLREAAASLEADRVSMREMLQAHGPEAHGTLLLLMAAPCMLPVPGVGTVLGLGVAALALAMWQGQGAPCLPARVARFEMSRHWAQRVLELLASAYTLAGRHARDRLGHFASQQWRSLIAIVVGLMAFVIVLPIPFGNVLPALSLMLIGVGLVFRDGLAVLLGLLLSAAAVMVTAGLFFVAVWGGEQLLGWV